LDRLGDGLADFGIGVVGSGFEVGEKWGSLLDSDKIVR
jgi:hypothetical protein